MAELVVSGSAVSANGRVSGVWICLLVLSGSAVSAKCLTPRVECLLVLSGSAVSAKCLTPRVECLLVLSGSVVSARCLTPRVECLLVLWICCVSKVPDAKGRVPVVPVDLLCQQSA